MKLSIKLNSLLSIKRIIHLQKRFLRKNNKPRVLNEDIELGKNKKEENFDINKILEKDIKKENNLYLQVLSCLSKTEIDENEKTELNTKLKDIIKDEQIKINDKKIMNIVKNEPLKNNNDELSNNIKKIIEAELSEEDHVEKYNFRFVRPPHSSEELKKVLYESEKIYDENKKFLLVNDKQVIKNYSENFIKKIPRFFTLRKLVYPETKTEILVCGVRRNSNIHSAFLAKILEKLSPDAIMLHMPPDIPLFIETENDYKSDWKSFIQKGKDSYFVLNPLPSTLNDTLITIRKIENLIEKTFKNSKDINISSKIVFSVQSIYYLIKETLYGEEYFGDAFLTTFLHSYHSKANKFCPIYVCDYPILRQIENIVNTVKLDQLKEYFNLFISELGKQHYDFHPEFLGYKYFLDNRLRYTLETVRQACYSNKKLCLVTSYKYVDKIMDNWRHLNVKGKNLTDFYPRLVKKDTDILSKGIVKNSPEEDKYSQTFTIDPDEMSYIDFIEKTVITDFFFQNFINDNFIRHQSFPYSGKHTSAWMSGFCNLFSLWTHYMKTYREKIDEYGIHDKEYHKYFNQFNYNEENYIEEEEKEENLDEETKKFQEELENPANREILKELKINKPLVADEIIQNNNPFKAIKKKK